MILKHNQQPASPSFSKKKPTRLYRMTIASVWYDEDTKGVKEYEIHYKAAQIGAIKDIRQQLAKRCVPHFQQTIYRKFKRWIPKGEIRVSFEREQSAISAETLISIEARKMEGVGKRNQWKAYPLPSRMLSYAKKTRKCKLRA